MLLNLGCGKDIRFGWFNVDVVDFEGIDEVVDLNKLPWPFLDNSVDQICCRMVLEHLDISTAEFFKEVHRILRKGGTIQIIVPHYSGRYAFYDEHKKFFTYQAFNINNTLETEIFKEFIELYRYLSFPRAWWKPFAPIIEKIANWKPYLYEDGILSSISPAWEMEVVLEKNG